jgi:hypothetical protein
MTADVLSPSRRRSAFHDVIAILFARSAALREVTALQTLAAAMIRAGSDLDLDTLAA